MRDSDTYGAVMTSYNILITASLVVMLGVRKAIDDKRFDTALERTRISINLLAANVALIAIAILAFTHLLRGPANFIIQHWPYLRKFGTEFTAKILDYIVGGAVFEAFRRLYSRFMAKFLSKLRTPKHSPSPAKEMLVSLDSGGHSDEDENNREHDERPSEPLQSV